MWKNKHVLVAVLVAPVLAVVAWFSVDHFVSEKPHAARPGADYPLAARSNCRYESGACDLVNNDFKLRITAPEGNTQRLLLEVAAEFPLRATTVGNADAVLQIVVVAGETRYFAEVPTTFLQTE